MSDTRRRRIGITVTIAAIFGTGAWLGTALADRSPTAPPLVYSGVILDATGAPVPDSDTNSVSLSLYDGADGSVDTLLCPTITSSTVSTRGGNFSLPLSAACSDVFLAAPEAWAHATINGTTVSPTRIGAVPYAVTAERVVYGGANGVSEGLFCGYSASGTTGAFTAAGGLTGYAAARSICAATCASPTAHICELAELTRSLSLGPMPIPTGTGVPGVSGLAWYAADPGLGGASACRGYTSAAAGDWGGVWQVGLGGTFGAPDRYDCMSSLAPIACCD